MAMEIILYSSKTVEETVTLIAVTINNLRHEYKDRFWFSMVSLKKAYYREGIIEEYGFDPQCSMLICDNTKDFDGLDTVARRLRNALGSENAIVIYADSSKLFPEADYM